MSALDPVLRLRGGTWIGWPGIALASDEVIPTQDEPYTVAPVRLSESEISRYYHGFSNRTLWPLFHSMPGQARFERLDFQTYERVAGVYKAKAFYEATQGRRPQWKLAYRFENEFSKTLERDVSRHALAWANKVKKDFAAARTCPFRYAAHSSLVMYHIRDVTVRNFCFSRAFSRNDSS